LLFIRIVLLFALFTSMLVDAEPLDGLVLYTHYQCHICHGENGLSPAQAGYPVIGGQDKMYLIRQILDIRDGVRDNGKANVMRPLVKQMKDKEIESVADYLSSQH